MSTLAAGIVLAMVDAVSDYGLQTARGNGPGERQGLVGEEEDVEGRGSQFFFRSWRQSPLEEGRLSIRSIRATGSEVVVVGQPQAMRTVRAKCMSGGVLGDDAKRRWEQTTEVMGIDKAICWHNARRTHKRNNSEYWPAPEQPARRQNEQVSLY